MVVIKVLVGIGYFALGLLQFFATWAGLVDWLGLNGILAFLLALFLAWMPVIGSVMGVFGAIYAWGWSPLGAILLFVGPPAAFLIVVAVTGGLAALFAWRRGV